MKNKTRKEGGQPGNKNAEKWTEEIALELGQGMVEWLRPKYVKDKKTGKTTDLHASNFFYEDYVINEQDLHPNIIGYLSKKFDSFYELEKKAMKVQELKLCRYGIAKGLNPAVLIFVLKNKHGFRDKQDIEVSGNMSYEISEKFLPKGKAKKGNGK